ncbi:MAG: hypothetical protein NZ789_05970, partial [Pseudomonadales bacterium]|nr:hypothetical protein [Pseudomonadales bacterium]
LIDATLAGLALGVFSNELVLVVTMSIMLLVNLLMVGSLQLLAIAQPFLVLGAVFGYTFQLSGLLELDLLALTCPANGRYLSDRIQLLN